jgi:hypothetical protein
MRSTLKNTLTPNMIMNSAKSAATGVYTAAPRRLLLFLPFPPAIFR